MQVRPAMTPINEKTDNLYGSDNGRGTSASYGRTTSDRGVTGSFGESEEEINVELSQLQRLMQSKVFWGVTVGVLGAIGGGIAYAIMKRNEERSFKGRLLAAATLLQEAYPKVAKKAINLFD
jgi:hypothetical protein